MIWCMIIDYRPCLPTGVFRCVAVDVVLCLLLTGRTVWTVGLWEVNVISQWARSHAQPVVRVRFRLGPGVSDGLTLYKGCPALIRQEADCYCCLLLLLLLSKYKGPEYFFPLCHGLGLLYLPGPGVGSGYFASHDSLLSTVILQEPGLGLQLSQHWRKKIKNKNTGLLFTFQREER